MNATQRQARNRRAALTRLRRAEMYRAELNAEIRRAERLVLLALDTHAPDDELERQLNRFFELLSL